MSKFTLPKRVDNELANDGVNFVINDEFGNDWGTYKLAWMDTESQRGQKRIQRFKKQHQVALNNKTMTNDEFIIRLLVTNYMVDWKLPKAMTGGKELQFNHEDAIDLLTHEDSRWLADTLVSKASDITNFGVMLDSDDESVDPAKN